MSDDVYEVYAIKYGRHERNSRANFIGGDSHDVPMPLDYFVWVIRPAGGAPGAPWLLDTGYVAATGAARGRQLVRPVEVGLSVLGIEPAAAALAAANATEADKQLLKSRLEKMKGAMDGHFDAVAEFGVGGEGPVFGVGTLHNCRVSAFHELYAEHHSHAADIADDVVFFF